VQRQPGDSQIKQGKMSLEIFYEKFTEGLAHLSGREIELKVRLTGQLKEFQ
jgi:hypothetical protein